MEYFGLVVDFVTMGEKGTEWFKDKDELLNAYNERKNSLAACINRGDVVLYPVIRYEWDEIENLF